MSLIIWTNKNKKVKNIVIKNGTYIVKGTFTISNKGITRIDNSIWTKIKNNKEKKNDL